MSLLERAATWGERSVVSAGRAHAFAGHTASTFHSTPRRELPRRVGVDWIPGRQLPTVNSHATHEDAATHSGHRDDEPRSCASAASSCICAGLTHVLVLLVLFIGYSLVMSTFYVPIGILFYLVPSFKAALPNTGISWHATATLMAYVPLVALGQQVFAVTRLVLFKRICAGTASRRHAHQFSRVRAQGLRPPLVMRLLMFGFTRGFTETLFMRPILRLMGLKIGPGAEIDVSSWPAPDMVNIGEESMVNGGAVLASPVVSCGLMTLSESTLGYRTFLGNMSVVQQGSTLGSESLLGVMSCAPHAMESGSTYLGSPAFSLKTRAQWGHANQGAADDSLTFNPPWYLYIARFFMNVIKVISSSVMILSLTVMYSSIYAITQGYISGESASLWSWQRLCIWTLVTLTFPIAVVICAVAVKWILMCKYRPVQKPMWSMFIWRSDIVYEFEMVMRTTVTIFDGTALINWIYRLMGVQIGRHVFMIGTTFMEHDLTKIRDGAVLAGATLQTHLYEDRFYKTGPVVIGPGAHIAPGGFALYDSEMARGSTLAAHSLLMRNEKFQAHKRYYGLPSEPAIVPRPMLIQDASKANDPRHEEEGQEEAKAEVSAEERVQIYATQLRRHYEELLVARRNVELAQLRLHDVRCEVLGNAATPDEVDLFADPEQGLARIEII